MGIIFFIRTFKTKFESNNEIIILMYHRVCDINNHDLDNDAIVTTQNFDEQMEYISRNYKVISFDTFIKYYENNKKLPKNSIIITFDDGYKDCYLYAYPILKKYNAPAIFFLTTDYINSDKLFWWDKIAYIINNTDMKSLSINGFGTFSLEDSVKKEKTKREIFRKLKSLDTDSMKNILNQIENELKVKISYKESNNLYLTWKEIKEMGVNGMDFGAHTCSHSILTKIPLEKVQIEAMKSKSIIQENLSKEVIFFSYPNGTINDFDENIKNILKYNGYKASVTNIYGINDITDDVDLFSLKRIDVNSIIDINLFKLRLTGLLDIVYEFKKNRKKYYHGKKY